MKIKHLILFACLLPVFVPGLSIAATVAEKNITYSCDSTCLDAKVVERQVTEKKYNASNVCGDGYTTNTTTYTENNNSATTKTTNDCNCVPTTGAQNVSCPAGQVGIIAQSRNWTCSNNIGSWSSWTTTSSNCYTPCVSQGSQQQNLGCPAYYSGSHIQQRDSYCPSVSGSPAWGGWYDVSNCVAECPNYPGSSAANCPYVGKYASLTVGGASTYAGYGHNEMTVFTFYINANNTVTTKMESYIYQIPNCYEATPYTYYGPTYSTTALQPMGNVASAFLPEQYLSGSPYYTLTASGILYNLHSWSSAWYGNNTQDYFPLVLDCSGGGG